MNLEPPPEKLVRSPVGPGTGDFDAIGDEFLSYFVDLAKLQPTHCVLDVGCGVGRMALPLTKYLHSDGEYWGFDIVKEGIEWCEENISSEFANFHFKHVDVYNKTYNKKGQISPAEFKFPHEDGLFDFVFLTSVFTHMLAADVEQYLDEIFRVLKPGGTCLATFFILNDESGCVATQELAGAQFDKRVPDHAYLIRPRICFALDASHPEQALAYDEGAVRDFFGRAGFSITQLHYGSWPGRDLFLSFQDLVIAKR